MKKVLLVVVAMLCVATVSAQSKFESSVKTAAKAIAAQKWSVGLRVGSGVQADVECFYSNNKYLEARLGLGIIGGLGADFSILHNWNCCNWDWTPNAGSWFLDAGVGINIGGYNNSYGAADVLYVGVTGDVKFGIKFAKVPIRLALDLSPAFGPSFHLPYSIKVEEGAVFKYSGSVSFHKSGIFNFGLSATYCF